MSQPSVATSTKRTPVEDGDEISFDLLAGEITLQVGDEDLTKRRAQWTDATPVYERRAYLADFSATVAQANYGCVSRAHYPECE